MRCDIIGTQTGSILTRRHIKTEKDKRTMIALGGIFLVMKYLVADDDQLSDVALEQARDFAVRSFSALTKSNTRKKKNVQLSNSDLKSLTGINRKALAQFTGEMARNEGKFTQSVLAPGFGKDPQISTCGYEVNFQASVWSSWSKYTLPNSGGGKEGTRARRLATEFAVLAAHRALAKSRQGNSAATDESNQALSAILATLDRGGILFGIVSKSPDSMSVDGDIFFDDAQIVIINKFVDSTATSEDDDNDIDGNDVNVKVEVKTAAGTKTTDVRIQPEFFGAFGLLGVRSVNVNISLLGDDDDNEGEDAANGVGDNPVDSDGRGYRSGYNTSGDGTRYDAV